MKTQIMSFKDYKESFFSLLDLTLSNFYDLEVIKREINEKMQKKDFFELLVFLDLLNFLLERMIKRISYSNDSFIIIKKLGKKEKVDIENFLRSYNLLIKKAEELKSKIIKEKKVKKSYLKELTKNLEIISKVYIKILDKLFFLLSFSQNIKVKNLLIKRGLFDKFDNLKKENLEDFIFLLKDIIFNNLRNFKVINDFFLEVKDKNIVIILRKDSLYVKDFLIIEDILNLENLKDFEKYNKYWKNELLPLEEENKELENFFLEGVEANNYYIKMDSEEFLVRYYF
ncbi:MAG TPA: hypothetical protein EYH54_03785 [Nautiliaceae bacterium]|nr:hypothetical protein [Nautiliaceae bacterium]